MSAILFDDSHWPLLITRYTGVPTPREFEEYLARRLAYMQRREKHVVITDTRQAPLIPPEQRARHVEWTREHEALRKEALTAHVVIITSPVVRLALNLAVYLWRGSVPYYVATTMREATRWAADRMEGAGHPAEAERVRHQFASSA